MTRRDPGNPPATEPSWPPRLPHPEIDELMERLERGDLEPWELQRLCLLIGAELRRVRNTVARLTTDRLEAARAEARSILDAARDEAARVGTALPGDQGLPEQRGLAGSETSPREQDFGAQSDSGESDPGPDADSPDGVEDGEDASPRGSSDPGEDRSR